MKTKDLILVSLFAAITSIFSQISIPIQPVPFTFQILAVALSGAILGKKYGALSQVIYLLLGSFGVPVFAGFKGGFNILIGPTGGYLIAFPLAAYITGIFSKKKDCLNIFIGMFIGLVVIYILGMFQLKFILNLSYSKAFSIGVAPFLVFDIIKIFISSFIASQVLKKSRIKIQA
ncbi:biotin transport system substrate-specific component [Alkalithermobacter thermoalcaliphilus JW-YL-7 = DSM 7308]|uniref:Biotin transporter n=1 Tax=Alkalithermobacter thermoalcaliphilus JW-YL-7 = DSM 7308 TaxID=1121328 RepID=A0A150FPH4_CLOPD|nr:BioY protein [[Clostridium] paradoxum JW-YL-7 = DSM 7308]SHL06927.1 biotin transport system substrate-specific component [[Clostridium] paradoxum JW-YL-7 = DSM 7308]